MADDFWTAMAKDERAAKLPPGSRTAQSVALVRHMLSAQPQPAAVPDEVCICGPERKDREAGE
jgi:hypothetical protein